MRCRPGGPLLLAVALTAQGAEAPSFRPERNEAGRPFLGPIEPGRPGPPFSMVKAGEAWWLVSPEGRRFFSLGVCCVNRGQTREGFDSRNPGYASWRKHPDAASWADAVLERLRSWGFTTVGGWSDDPVLIASKGMELAFTPVLHMGSTAGAPWFDLWDPQVIRRMEETAARTIDAVRGDPRLLGYYLDNELGWWNAALVKMAFEQPTSSGQRRRLVGLLQDRYHGDWKALLADFDPEGAGGFDELDGKGRLFLRSGGNGILALRDFLSVIARRYYQLAREIVRRRDGRALILGDRYQSFYYPEVARAAAEEVDIISSNLNAHWSDGTFSRYALDTLHGLTGKPILVSEFYMAARENRSGDRNSHGMFPTAPTQEERAAGLRNTLGALARLPYVVGADWFQYYDEPPLGREDGEDFDFGLVDVEDRPYEEVTAAFASARPFRAKEGAHPARANASGGIPPARGDPLASFEPQEAMKTWDRERGFVRPTSPLALADLHLTWDPQALYLGLEAQEAVEGDYYRDGRVPEEDRALWSVEMGSRPAVFRVRLGAGRPPAGIEGGAAVRGISGGRMTSHFLAVMKVPAALLSKERLRAGDAFRLSATLLSHARAWRTEWSGEFKLAQ